MYQLKVERIMMSNDDLSNQILPFRFFINGLPIYIESMKQREKNRKKLIEREILMISI